MRELFSERQEEIIKVLRELLSKCQDELICVQIARLWKHINPGDPEAVDALTKLKESSKKSEVRYLADDSLREFVPLQQASCNPTIINPINFCQASLENINNLLEIIYTSQDGATRRQAVKNLEKISAEHIKALIEVLHSTPWKRTRIQAIKSLEKIGIDSPEAIKALVEVLHSSYCNKTREQAVKSIGEIDAGSPEVIKVLIEVLHSSPYKKTRHQAVISLGKIGVGNLEAIKALVEVLHSNQERHIRIRAVESLEKIGTDSPEAIKALVGVLHSSQDISFYAVLSLGKIGAANPEAIKALVEMLHSSKNLYVCIQAAQSLSRIGVINLEVLTTWIELLRTSIYNTDLFQAYWNLWVILRGTPYSKVVSNSDLVLVLKDCLTTQVAKNYPARYIYCYEILWYCAQNMPYPAFYQTWYNEPAPTQSLNLAELPHSLATAVANDLTLSQTIRLICIDGSKFIDRDNPATKIYTEMVKSGCPKCEDGTPKTMQELQAYWDLLNTDKRVVLVFYESTGFSETFLNALSKFDGAICVITAQPIDNIPLQYFSPNQAIADVVGWLK